MITIITIQPDDKDFPFFSQVIPRVIPSTRMMWPALSGRKFLFWIMEVSCEISRQKSACLNICSNGEIPIRTGKKGLQWLMMVNDG